MSQGYYGGPRVCAYIVLLLLLLLLLKGMGDKQMSVFMVTLVYKRHASLFILKQGGYPVQGYPQAGYFPQYGAPGYNPYAQQYMVWNPVDMELS